MTDDRIWRPDLLAVLDWEAVGRATEKVYGKRQLATWWVQATPGVNYYRAEMPAKHLPGRTVRLETRDVQFEGGEHYFPRQRGAAIWMFPGNITRWLLMAEMKDNGRRVLVEVDDNYTTGPPVSLSGWTVKQRDNPDASYEAHVKIVGSKACDGVIVATPQLGRVYERFGKPIYVCRNSVDVEDWPEDPDHQPDGVLRIGWAGSASHQYDLADIRPALDWASRQKDVEIVVLGQLDPGVPHRNVPWTDKLSEYRVNVQQIDIMLCPLRPSLWADCKSDVKALEAAMGGACSVVSRTEPYRPWWDGEGPGYVAETRKDYVKVLKHLVANREEVRETATLAREYATTKRNIVNTVESWREAVA